MNKLLIPFWLLYKLYFGITFLVMMVVLYPFFWVILKGINNHYTAFKLMRAWAFSIQIVSLIFIYRLRKIDIPDEPCVIISNHTSYLDIILMYVLIPKPFVFMGKHEILKWPMLNIFFKEMNIAVNRESRSAAARSLVHAKQKIEKGWHIVLFPEGTIPYKNPKMIAFKKGAFQLAVQMQVPIMPLTFVNHWKLFADPTIVFGPASPGLAKVVMHDLIETKGKTQEDVVSLRKECFNIIDETLRKHNPNTFKKIDRNEH